MTGITRQAEGVAIGLIILGGLFAADIATTEYIISNGGHEDNPVMIGTTESQISHFILKAGVLALIAVVVILSNSFVKNSGSTGLVLMIIWYLIVVTYNLNDIIEHPL